MPTLHPYYAAIALTALGLFALFSLVFVVVGARRGVGAGIGATAVACAAATALVFYVVLPAYPDPPAGAGEGATADEGAGEGTGDEDTVVAGQSATPTRPLPYGEKSRVAD